MIKYGADLNAQDFQGQTPLHIAVVRLRQEPDQYDDYKRIIKELLFKGARRDIRSSRGLTPLEQLEQIKESLDEDQFKSLQFILTEYKENMCFMRHRPIKKVRRSSAIFLTAVLLNLGIMFVYYYKLDKTPVIARDLHFFLIYASYVLFVIAVPSFLISAFIQPGYLKPEFNFMLLVDKLLD